MTAQLMTRDELQRYIEPLERLSEVTAPTTEWRFGLEDNKIVAEVNDEQYPVSLEAMETALSKVPGLNKAAVQQWPVDLLLDTVNWFYEHGEADTRALTQDNRVINFTKSTGPMHPVSEVIEHMTSSIGSPEDVRFSNVRVSLDRVALGLVAPSRAAEPKVGDVVQAGIWLMHSPTARSAGEISPYVNRLVCTNGMISSRSLQKWSWRGNGDFLEWVDNATAMAWDAIDIEFQGLHELTEQRLNGHARVVVEDIFERHHVPVGLRETILEHLVDEADGTMYGVAQAFNRAANHLDDIGQMRSLLMVTGDIAAQSERCDSCFRSL